MKAYYLIALLFILKPGYSFSQEDICIGKKYKMFSGYLQEEREYQVFLPASYQKNGDSQKKYPVIYLTDSESFFHSLTAIHTTFSRGRMALMPEWYNRWYNKYRQNTRSDPDKVGISP
ncbi:MAG: hypothetical protein LBV72_14335 [Tannerella sp.]|jgi:predicted alpha/beta superfamily hydrolase|nr:hypothetical protein [Tannerella sp.]